MFCNKCGANVEGAFCPRCGNPVAIEPQINPVPQPTAPPFTAPAPAVYPGAPVNNKKSNKKALPIIIGAVVLVIAIICGIIFIPGLLTSPESVAEKYMIAYFEYDYDAMAKYLPYDIEDAVTDSLNNYCYEYDEDLYEIYSEIEDDYEYSSYINNTKDIFTAVHSYYVDEWAYYYGEDYEITSKVLSCTRLTEYDLNYEVDYFIDDFEYYDLYYSDYFNEDKVSKGYEVEISAKIKGSEDYDSDTFTVIVVKYGSKWCVLDTEPLDVY